MSNYNEALQGNNAALEEILETAKNLPQGTGVVQTDYLQNDPTAPDYLKHRPFCSKPIWKVIHEPKTIQVWDDSFSHNGSVGVYKAYPHFLDDTYPDGTVFKIVVGEDKYVGTYKDGYVGNGGLYQFGPDTGEDFLIFGYGASEIGIVTKKPLTVCEVSIYQMDGEEIEPIHPKYLPPEVFTGTEEQMAQLAAMVLDVLKGQVITGYIDSDNNIVIMGLPEGEYTVKYEMADGSTIDIGALALGGSGQKNLADPASADWLVDHRLSTSGGGGSALAGHTLTNFIPAKMGDTLRVKGLNLKAADVNGKPSAVGIYTADKSYQANFVLTGMSGTSSADAAGYQVTQNGDVFEYTILMDDTGAQRANAQTAFIRIDGVLMDGYAKGDVIITINEPIE